MAFAHAAASGATLHRRIRHLLQRSVEVDEEDGAPRDESSMDADPNGVAGLLAEEADDDMVADPRTDEYP